MLAAAGQTGNRLVTAPAVDNVATVFEFFERSGGLHYDDKTDSDVLKHKTESGVDVPARVDVFQAQDSGPTTRQVVQYVSPSDSHRLAHAELVIVDEAAALPLPVVEKLLGPYVVFLASTVTGYEGTGRALQLKLLLKTTESPRATRRHRCCRRKLLPGCRGNSQQKKGQQKVHEQRWAKASKRPRPRWRQKYTERDCRSKRPWYASGDAVEAWLHRALCLDSPTKSVYALKKGLPRTGALLVVLKSIETRSLVTTRCQNAFCNRSWRCTPQHITKTPERFAVTVRHARAHRLFVLLGPT